MENSLGGEEQKKRSFGEGFGKRVGGGLLRLESSTSGLEQGSGGKKKGGTEGGTPFKSTGARNGWGEKVKGGGLATPPNCLKTQVDAYKEREKFRWGGHLGAKCSKKYKVV